MIIITKYTHLCLFVVFSGSVLFANNEQLMRVDPYRIVHWDILHRPVRGMNHNTVLRNTK